MSMHFLLFSRHKQQAEESPRIWWVLQGMTIGKPCAVQCPPHLVLENSDRSGHLFLSSTSWSGRPCPSYPCQRSKSVCNFKSGFTVLRVMWSWSWSMVTLWNKIDLPFWVMHCLPITPFWALCNHVSPNDFLFQLDYQHPAGVCSHLDNCL